MQNTTSQAFFTAITEGNLEQVCTLLDAGADPNTTDANY